MSDTELNLYQFSCDKRLYIFKPNTNSSASIFVEEEKHVHIPITRGVPPFGLLKSLKLLSKLVKKKVCNIIVYFNNIRKNTTTQCNILCCTFFTSNNFSHEKRCNKVCCTVLRIFLFNFYFNFTIFGYSSINLKLYFCGTIDKNSYCVLIAKFEKILRFTQVFYCDNIGISISPVGRFKYIDLFFGVFGTLKDSLSFLAIWFEIPKFGILELSIRLNFSPFDQSKSFLHLTSRPMVKSVPTETSCLTPLVQFENWLDCPMNWSLKFDVKQKLS
ncbi:hypothetical protein BpHYR1_019507 [Brachionus plicatilis]|uniref:Uncharacterized protein n=1 Tax=Brachionus plicatilis TaxID=10195 RepID=A0A3M7SKH6_BRAPC|nr:hypothetical protein BpHYR1_019507 [Brachionus plicatilis]